MSTKDDKTPPKGTPENPATEADWDDLESKKHLSPEVQHPREATFWAQLRETTAHATTPEASGLEVARTQALTPDFDPTAPLPELGTGGPPPTIPPKDPPSDGGGDEEDASRNEPLWLVVLKDLFKDKRFVMGFVGLLFLIVGYTAYYWINRFNNSPESLAAQKQNIILLKEMEEIRGKSASRSIFSSNPSTTSTSLTSGCVVTAQDRANNNFGGRNNCSRIKYEQTQNDPGMYFDFGKGARVSSIEGQYRLLNGRELLCQTENPSEEKFSTDGCASVLSDKRLTSIGLAPLHQDGIIVTFTSK